VTKIELLAIEETLNEFKGMLQGQRIKVFTEHKNLIQEALGLTSDHVYQWSLLLEEFGPKMVHIKGIHNTVACAISRLDFGLIQPRSLIQKIIRYQCLLQFLDNFPRFFSAIQQRVMQEEISVAVEGLNFLPLDLFGLIDCLIDRICWPFSGPDGDYVGAPRKEQYACTQWEFYTSYKTCHGIKVETVLLPNGISTVYGPVSVGLHDTARVLNMSGLNQFWIHIHWNKQYQYQVMGDGVYRIGCLEFVWFMT